MLFCETHSHKHQELILSEIAEIYGMDLRGASDGVGSGNAVTDILGDISERPEASCLY